ncbi:Transposable element P transposase [Amphibalanus amphitrite]|uniref:Transposable element P transposase n=1 Tax=Amphibalanus amphitrite TaxID=1232801 RepID=A0A6A4VVT2_AMPAM|nr:Transposable element P transposase [Amphibalanus amphitrite]
MSGMERLCVLCFDEMSLNGGWCYDQMTNRAMSATKLQLLMVRGLCASWRQPCYYGMSAPMNMTSINDVVDDLEVTGLRVIAAVSDMEPSNERMWRQAGVSDSQSCIARRKPSRPERLRYLKFLE